jgi:hypothetical protein
LRFDIHLSFVCFYLQQHISGGEGIACRLSVLTSPVSTVRPAPSLTFQVAMLPSVIVGESAGMVKFCAASEAGPAWNAASFPSVMVPVPMWCSLTSSPGLGSKLLRHSSRRQSAGHGNRSHGNSIGAQGQSWNRM